MAALPRLIAAIDRLNERVGRAIAWLVLVMALTQFAVVILRYVLAIGFIPMQESIWYMHGVLFMAAAGYTLLHDGHVRVDIFYREARPRARALVDLIGALILLLPLCVLTVWLSWSYVLNSWRVLEGSTEVSGLPLIYLLKTVIWLFAVLLGLQGLALAGRAWLHLAGGAGDYSPKPPVDQRT